jgi:phosphoribosyl-ATP pyrophosphohydrolase/phosphoribosyl-AMP cyclohydrolase
MIIPSIDIMDGRAVQLRRGRDFVLDGGDPLERLEEFAVVGEVAIVDLDAALGRGSNTDLIREMVRRARCRVGGGIRDIDSARAWLDAGAVRVVIGTRASVDFCAQLPRDRVVAAVDAEHGEVVVEGWTTRTGLGVIDRIRELSEVVGGFLLTQVEREGEMGGFDAALVERAVDAAGSARVTAAGGITTVADIVALDRIGADGQVGMALYTGRMTLGAAFAAPLCKSIDGLWPTVVCAEGGTGLGLVWSSRESLEAAVQRRQGIYWSRSRNELWVKGETSGATQELLRVAVDCDRDALRFTVRQHGTGFCHTGKPTCWPRDFSLEMLDEIVRGRAASAPPGSGTARLLETPGLLESKLLEEAGELAAAGSLEEATHEAADLLYFTLVGAARWGASLVDVIDELRRRHLRVGRRPMEGKVAATDAGDAAASTPPPRRRAKT